MEHSKEYNYGFNRGINSLSPDLGMFNRDDCCLGYVHGSQMRKQYLLNPARPFNYEEPVCSTRKDEL